MANEAGDQLTRRPAGYAELIDRYGLETIPPRHRSEVALTGTHRINTSDGVTVETFPSKYWPGETLGDHLEFALKYDGTDLAVLAAVFGEADERELVDYIGSKPTGKYARRLWFFYEFLTGRRLPLDDLSTGNYVDALDPTGYYTTSPPRRVRRQRVNDNLPGDRRFCPLIRRSRTLQEYEAADLPERCREVVSGYSPQLVKRALGYLYNKETKSSFEIESIQPSSSRAERFVALLQLAEREDFVKTRRLVELQNRIVDERFREDGYRTSQNYVGETVAWQRERIHYAPPKPDDLTDLMDGLLATHDRIEAGGTPTVIHAAAISYGFVFLHPFEDGNGRIHRFLIHNILARRGFSPTGLMFPVSASMLRNPGDYDESLEAFSRPLMPLVEYSLDNEGRMTVHNDTAQHYRFIDLTPQTEALFGFIEQTIESELASELAFLASYDETKKAIQEIVDLPDLKIDLFIRLCVQNDGRLSARKRRDLFNVLTDDEISRMEKAVRTAYTQP
ncbi:MAG: Fic family protein [Thermoanaerobaculales bacterium]|jgi:hypothetical protein|nr:Fic family protein [Thermoanaerobaculales bacterium]